MSSPIREHTSRYKMESAAELPTPPSITLLICESLGLPYRLQAR